MRGDSPKPSSRYIRTEGMRCWRRSRSQPWAWTFSGPSNKGMQLTSGGFERATRATSLMRRLQLIPVFAGPALRGSTITA